MTTTPLSTVLSQITTLPWREERRHPDPETAKGYAEIFGPNGEGVHGPHSSLSICCAYCVDEPRHQAHIDYILHATALLPDLVVALEEMERNYANPDYVAEVAAAVLAKAKSVPSTTVPCPTTQ